MIRRQIPTEARNEFKKKHANEMCTKWNIILGWLSPHGAFIERCEISLEPICNSTAQYLSLVCGFAKYC